MISFYFLFYLRELFVSKWSILLISRNLVISTSIWLWHSTNIAMDLWMKHSASTCGRPGISLLTLAFLPRKYARCARHSLVQYLCCSSLRDVTLRVDSALGCCNHIPTKIICHGVYMSRNVFIRKRGNNIFILAFFK